jgi:protein-disulfide isomerase
MKLALSAALLVLGLAGVISAQPAGPVLAIENATPDAGAGTVTIAGAGFGARPFVTLDLVPLNLQLALDQRIVATVPVEMIPPGTYLLTVTRGAQPGDTASIDLRIGPSANAPGSAAPPTLPGGPSSASPSTSSAAMPLPGGNDVAAHVGDRTITVADIDREWQRTDPIGFLAAGRQLYDARRRIVTDLVNNELLAREAASRGITVDALLAQELPKRTIALPDTAVSSLYQSLGSRTRGATIDQLRPALREWLKKKVEPELAKMSYVEELTKVSTRAEISLRAPRVSVEHHPDDPAIGPAGAPVELVIFGDFQNATYSRYALTLPRVRDLFGSRVRIVFKHFPANDPASIAAAEAAACANVQGKFWPFHDTLLGRAGALDAARFRSVATEIGLDRTKFDSCLDNHEMRDRIGAALEETRRYDLAGSPSLLVDGQLAPEPPAFLPPFEYLKRVVEEELQQQAMAAR